MSRHPSNQSPLSTRFAASFAAALVLVLTVLAVSPALHAWLHSDSATHSACSHDHGPFPPGPSDEHGDDAGCVVTLFAHGGAELAVAPALLAPVSLCRLATLAVASIPAAAAPAHILPPGCGPPLV